MYLIFVLLMALVNPVHAQVDSIWSRTYGGDAVDQCYALDQTTDGGYVLAGITRSFGAGGNDVWILKTDANGDSIWSRTYGGSSWDWCYDMVQTTDGGYVFCGSRGGSGGWLFKLDANGDSAWSHIYSNYIFHGVQETQNESLIFGGQFWSESTSHYDLALIKMSGQGDSLWCRHYGDSSRDEGAQCIRRTADGGYIVAGWIGNGPEEHTWVIKTDSVGDTLWSREINNATCFAVGQSTHGTYFVAGSSGVLGAGDQDVWLMGISEDGDSLWSKTYGTSEWERGYTMEMSADGGCVLAGSTDSFGAGGPDFWLIKTDSNGDSLWSRTFGRSTREECYAVQRTPDGGYILGGFIQDPPTLDTRNFWLLKTTPELASAMPLAGLPTTYTLSAFPNPFNPATTIAFDLPQTQRVRLAVYDLLGREVAMLLNERLAAGTHTVRFDGAALPSGLYFARLQSGANTTTHKLLLLK